LTSKNVNLATAQDTVAPAPLEFIVDQIISNLSCESVYLFGSRARGDSTEGSDIDLVIVIRMTGVLRSLLGVRNLRRRLESLPFPVDIRVFSTLACSRNKRSQGLNLLHKERKLLYGKDFLASQLGVLGFAPSRDSIISGSCYNVRWFLRCIRLDNHVLGLDRGGLTKLIRVLRSESDVSAETIPPLLTLVKELEHETNLEIPDLRAVSRALANYIEAVMDESSALFPSRISQTASILIDKGRLLPRALLEKDSVCFRLTKALLCLLRSLETDPPDGELIHRAATYLGYLLYNGIQDPEGDPELLLMKVRNTIREYWDTVMRVPFGSLVVHRAFDIVLL